jgi:hypothetical protein
LFYVFLSFSLSFHSTFQTLAHPRFYQASKGIPVSINKIPIVIIYMSKGPMADYINLIKAGNLQETYLFGLEGVAALRRVSFDIKQGEFIIILGNPAAVKPVSSTYVEQKSTVEGKEVKRREGA